MHQWGGWSRALHGIGLSAALGWGVACGFGSDGDELDPALVREVTRGDIVDDVSESGKITPSFEVEIKAKVSGEVASVHVVEGQAVKKGDLLMTLVDTDYARNLQLSRVSVREAQLQLEAAELDRSRKKAAYESRGISEAEYDAAVRQVELAKVQLQRTRVQLSSSQDQSDYTHITSPIDGVVIVRDVEAGELVTAGVSATASGHAAMKIAQIDRLLLELDLNQVDVARVQIGQSARILLDAYPGVEVQGTVTSLAAAGHLDSTRGVDVFTVKVELDPSQSTVQIKPGMTAEVRIRVGSWEGVVKVPAETVFEEDGKSFVYRVDGGVKQKTEVSVGHRSDREVEIETGVAEGDKIYAQADVKDMSEVVD
jgi:RND family efflux transporter MFP subunit